MKTSFYNIISVIVGILTALVGLNSFYPIIPLKGNITETFKNTIDAFESVSWFLPYLGVVTLIGGLFLLFPKFRAAGAIILLPIFIGYLILNINSQASAIFESVLFLAADFYILYMNREKLRALFN